MKKMMNFKTYILVLFTLVFSSNADAKHIVKFSTNDQVVSSSNFTQSVTDDEYSYMASNSTWNFA